MAITKGNYELTRVLFDLESKRITAEIKQNIIEDGIVTNTVRFSVTERGDNFAQALSEMLPNEVVSDKSPRRYVLDKIAAMATAEIQARKDAQKTLEPGP